MKKIIIALLIFSSANVYGQPFADTRMKYYHHSGYIELNSGAKIVGNFQYAYWEFPSFNLKMFSSDGKVIKRYYIKDIKRVVLSGSNDWLTNMDSTYFIVYGGCRHFYRQLSFNEDFQLYDGFFHTDKYIDLVTNYFLIKTEKGFIKLRNAKRLKKWLKENYPNSIKWSDDITIQDIIRQLNGKV